MKLRPYQQEAIQAIEAGWSQFRRQLAVLPTGAGKTIIAANLTRRAVDHGQRVLFLAHREELLTQTLDKFRRAASINGQLEKAEYRAESAAQAVVGSVQTFMSRGYEWDSDHFDLIIVDEAHHALSDSYQHVLGMFPYARVLGITATPDRGDKKNLGRYFETIAIEITLLDLIRDGYLCPIKVQAVPISVDLNGVKQAKGDFDSADLAERLEPWLEQIADAIAEYASFRKTLVFVPLISTSKKFVEICRSKGFAAEHIDGKSEDRAEKLARFARGDFDILSNAMLLTEGYDDPSIECIVILRPTRSRPLFCQMTGRGCRPAPLKEDLLLLDFAYLHEKHSLIKPAHLVAKSDDEAKAIEDVFAAPKQQGRGEPSEQQTSFDLEEAVSEAAKQREDKLRETLKESSTRTKKVMSAEEWAVQTGHLNIAEYEETMSWETDALTDAQRRFLKRKKIDPESVRSKGHASQIISSLIAEEEATPASDKQKAAMRRAGHPTADTASAAEARRFFAQQNRNESKEPANA